MSETNGVMSNGATALQDSANIFEKIKTLITLQSNNVLKRLGLAYNGSRDYYKTLGYDVNLNSEDYNSIFKRQDIASAIVEAYPDATWREHPEVMDIQEPETSRFTKEFGDLAKRLKLFDYFKRADILACRGYYSVIFLGFSDARNMEMLKEPVKSGSKIRFISAYSDINAPIKSNNMQISNERFGYPELYSIDFGIDTEQINRRTNKSRKKSKAVDVHHTRVLHIAHGLLENDIYGRPILEKVYNLIAHDLMKIQGGGAESIWHTAQNKPVLSGKDDYVFPVDLEKFKSDLEERMENYLHDITSYLSLDGFDVSYPEIIVSDPKNHFDNTINLICCATKIPRRILLGSERGELGGDQDEKNWANQISTRQNNYATSTFIDQFIQKAILFGDLDPPIGGNDQYKITWPELITLSREEEGNAALKWAQAFKTAAEAEMLAPDTFPSAEIRVQMGLPAESEYTTDLEKERQAEEDIPEDIPNDNPDDNSI